MSGPRILFVADAGPQVGGGHVMRSLTLARALVAEGASVAFAATQATDALLDAFAPETPRRPTLSTTPQDLAQALAGEAFEAVVFDHYGLAEADHRTLAQGRPVLVVDDLADRPLGADLVVDAGPARTAEDYAALLPPGAELLLGPAHAAVRPEFAARRDAALARRGEPVRRILVSMGLTDLGGVTARVVERLRPRVGDVALDVVLGAGAQSLPGLSRIARHDPRIVLHVETPHMARLTAEADLAVGAPGSSTWERCVLGLPTVLVVLADNQKPAADALAAREAAFVVAADAADFDSAFDRAVTRLLIDPELRRGLATRSAALCDGQGAWRTARAFLDRIARASEDA